MKITKYLLVLCSFFMLVGCGPDKINVKSIKDLPPQDITTKPPEGKYQVIFFNDSGILNKIDSTDLLEITINGKYYGRIGSKEYLQLFLNKGSHKVTLVHYDMFTFESNHDVVVKNSVFIEASATPLSNNLEIVDSKPKNFEAEFKAAYWE